MSSWLFAEPHESLWDLIGYVGDNEKWRERAACAGDAAGRGDHELFFGDHPGVRLQGARLCARCPVAWECLQYAAENDEVHGTWGGYSPLERKAFLQKHHWKLTPAAQQEQMVRLNGIRSRHDKAMKKRP